MRIAKGDRAETVRVAGGGKTAMEFEEEKKLAFLHWAGIPGGEGR